MTKKFIVKPESLLTVSLMTCLFFCGTYSCTKLDTKVYDKVASFWGSPEQIAAGVAPAYSGLRNYAPGFWGNPEVYMLNEMSSDEIICPNRLTDWADDVIWEQMWKHTWGPTHQFVADGWQFVYGGVSSVNAILKAVDELNPKPSNLASIEAELKTIRAFYYYVGLDLFGNIPIVTDNNTDLSQLGNVPRAQVFAFVEKELKDNLTALSSSVNLETYGRATQWFAQAILAKLYLNAEVYSGTPRWADCIAACKTILDANVYSLEADFFSNFTIQNQNSKENIFSLPFDIAGNLNILSIQILTLHYFSGLTFGLESGGANGHCTPAAIYNLFDAKDKRRNSFIVGQQYVNQVKDSAHIQYDKKGNLLSFDPVITSFVVQQPKTEVAGARCSKWEFNKTGFGNMSNDFAIFRLSDIILMKSEAELRNGDAGAALSTINQQINGISIRNRAGMPDFQPSDMVLDTLLHERARELSWEGWRRNDLIRFNHFLDPRVPEKAQSESFRTLYPIPYNELAKNPYLVQNPGYQ